VNPFSGPGEGGSTLIGAATAALPLAGGIPATLAWNVAKVVKIQEALGKLKIATQTLDRAAACRF